MVDVCFYFQVYQPSFLRKTWEKQAGHSLRSIQQGDNKW